MQTLRVARPCRRAVDPTPELKDFDPLTGLAARSLFEQRLDQQWALCRDGHRQLGLLLLDFDKLGEFRANNHKHVVGAALADSAAVLKRHCRRRADLPARIRSGEFAVILSDVDQAGAGQQAEVIRAGIEALKIPRRADQPEEFLTVTIGLVCLVPPASHFPRALMIGCDQVLRDAKDQGRNCVGVRDGL